MVILACIVGAVLFVVGCAAKRHVEMYNGCAWDDDTE